MPTDINTFRNAMTAIIDGDATVQGLTDRLTLNLIPRSASVLKDPANLPVLTYEILAAPQRAGTGGNREVSVRFGSWARKSAKSVFDTIEGLLDRVELLMTGPNFIAQGLDAGRRTPIGQYRDGGEDDDVRWSFLDMQFDVKI